MSVIKLQVLILLRNEHGSIKMLLLYTLTLTFFILLVMFECVCLNVSSRVSQSCVLVCRSVVFGHVCAFLLHIRLVAVFVLS